MKIKIELELPEANIIFKALNVVDPTSIFCGVLKERIAKAAQPVTDKEKK